MSEMVEKVARAYASAWKSDIEKYVPDYRGPILTWDEMGERQRNAMMRCSRAAIEAMRWPSPAMIAAAWTVFDRYPHKRLGPGPGFKEAIAAAFDAALKE